MIDHSGVIVRDLTKSKAWYAAALAPIGYTIVMAVPAAVTGDTDAIGFGENGKPDFWLAGATPTRAAHTPGIHFAFRVPTRAMVDAFYRAAIAAGGTDNGPPGIRAHYHPDYYAAFVCDLDGHNIEAVCHGKS